MIKEEDNQGKKPSKLLEGNVDINYKNVELS